MKISIASNLIYALLMYRILLYIIVGLVSITAWIYFTYNSSGGVMKIIAIANVVSVFIYLVIKISICMNDIENMYYRIINDDIILFDEKNREKWKIDLVQEKYVRFSVVGFLVVISKKHKSLNINQQFKKSFIEFDRDEKIVVIQYENLKRMMEGE